MKQFLLELLLMVHIYSMHNQQKFVLKNIIKKKDVFIVNR